MVGGGGGSREGEEVGVWWGEEVGVGKGGGGGSREGGGIYEVRCRSSGRGMWEYGVWGGGGGGREGGREGG